MTDALGQYTALHDAQRALLDAGLPPAVNAMRARAREVLGREGVRLPRKGEEGWERTSLDAMLAPDYGLNLQRRALDIDLAATFRCGAGQLTPLTAVVANDAFTPGPRLASALPAGVEFTSLRRAPEALLSRWYGQVAPIDNPAVALNTMLVQDGVVVHAAAGVTLDKPLQVVNIHGSGVDTMSVRRVLVVAEEGATVKLLLCDHTQQPDRRFMGSQVVEVVCRPGARVEIYDIEESTPDTARHCMVYARQWEGSRFDCCTATLQCGATRNDITVDHAGPHCSTRLTGMGVGSGHMLIDTDTRINHSCPDCTSDQLYKFVLDDESEGSFEGRVVVAEGAVHTDARQTNRNMLASYGARMHTKPQLEIYNDDVKASHGATTGQLDSKALFYMQTRGIPLREARVMLMQAFLMDVVDSVGVDSLRGRLHHLVERRFDTLCGGGDLCATCLGQNP